MPSSSHNACLILPTVPDPCSHGPIAQFIDENLSPECAENLQTLHSVNDSNVFFYRSLEGRRTINDVCMNNCAGALYRYGRRRCRDTPGGERLDAGLIQTCSSNENDMNCLIAVKSINGSALKRACANLTDTCTERCRVAVQRFVRRLGCCITTNIIPHDPISLPRLLKFCSVPLPDACPNPFGKC